jgi:serine/threonine-protein kinase
LLLTPGTRLGAYEILAAIGAGGMGEVYKARDTKLNRDVALKILPEAFTLDGDRIARFRREAQVLAALNHPNIAAIHGFEDSGSTHALVLELVEGSTLADRIAKGPIPVDEALPIARQIAEALEAAHEQGIIHRDLKPANIKLRADGTVKVLDFGLAKAMEPASAISPAMTASPTITTPAQMTGVGMILGTAAYMSPEQAKGRPADKRSDIWAFGCVLYEMLTGKRAFEGEDVADTFASVLRGDVDWRSLSAVVPAGVGALLRHCLAKEPRHRIAHISTAQFVLQEGSFANSPSERSEAVAALAALTRRSRQWMMATMLLLIAIAGGIWVWLRHPASNLVQPLRFEIPLPAAQALAETVDRSITLAPDGTALVYVSGVTTRLMIRRLDRLQSEGLGDSGGVRYPFFSPDGKWVGYFRNGELRRVSVIGGIAQTVCRYTGVPRGATWGPDDTIVFTTSDPSTGLLAVPAGGGEPQVLTKPDASNGELDHVTPSWLPDGRGVLFSVTTQPDNAGHIAVLDRRTGRYRVLITGIQPEYVASGHLVFVAQGAVRAVPFDATSFTIRGNPESMEQVAIRGFTGVADYTVSRTGMLVFSPPAAGTQASGTRSLVWVTREGKEEAIRATPRAYFSLRLSPDDTRIALDIRERENNIWIWDVRSQQLTKLTDGTGDQMPVWTWDGRRIVFSSQRGGNRRVFRQFADGTGIAEPVDDGKTALWPGALSPDGSRLVVTQFTDKGGDDVSILSMSGDKKVTPLVNSGASERSPDLSPDGHWIAYQSDGDDGVNQIYVRPFPDVLSGRWRVSTSGGTHPIWGKNTSLRELFYVDNEGYLTAASFQTTPTFSVGRLTRVLQTPYFVVGTRGAVYDVTRDGQRFLMIKGDDSGGISMRLVAVLNWFEELKQRVPVK